MVRIPLQGPAEVSCVRGRVDKGPSKRADQRKTLLVTLLKDKVAIRSALHTATSCEVHAFLGDA